MTTETRVDGGAETATATSAGRIGRVQVCIVYDCLFPYTVGGAERWYRNLAERLAAERARGHVPDAAAVGAGRASRTSRACAWSRSGRGSACTRARAAADRCRRSSSGSACCAHLAAARAALRRRPHRLVPVLLAARGGRRAAARRATGSSSTGTRSGRATTGASTSGRVGGSVGWRVQRACLRVPQRAFCFSRLHERRLREEGVRGELTVLEGQYDGAARAAPSRGRPGRSSSSPAATSPRSACPRSCPRSHVAASRSRSSAARSSATGPSARRSLRAIAEHGLDDVVAAPGFVDGEVLERGARDGALPRAAVAPRGLRPRGRRGGRARGAGRRRRRARQRRGRAGRGGRQRRVAASARARRPGATRSSASTTAGAALRDSTAAWFAGNAERLSLERSRRRRCWRRMPSG